MLIIAASLMMFVQSFIQIIPPIAEKMGSYRYTCNIIVKKKINIICLVFIRLQFIGEKVSRKQH